MVPVVLGASCGLAVLISFDCRWMQATKEVVKTGDTVNNEAPFHRYQIERIKRVATPQLSTAGEIYNQLQYKRENARTHRCAFYSNATLAKICGNHTSVRKCLAVGLKRNGSWDGGSSVHAGNTDHGQSSVLDLRAASLGKCLGALVLAEAKGVEDSWAHALFGQEKQVIFECTIKGTSSIRKHIRDVPFLELLPSCSE